MYRVRIPIGIAFLCLVGLFFYIDLKTNTAYSTGIVLALLISTALWELYAALQKKDLMPYKNHATLFCFSGIILSIFAIEYPCIKSLKIVESYETFVLIFFLMYPVWKREEEKVLENTFSTLFAFLYIYFTLSYLMKIRSLGTKEEGLIYLLFVVLVSKGMDMGGYLLGKCIGKHKLCPSISPKKSWEGAFGGIVFSLLIAYWMRDSFSVLSHRFTWFYLMIFSFITGILSLWGDLGESLIKRRCQIKDSNNLIPEFGGILDMMDSLTFTAPFCYYFLVYMGA
ncbi:MAG: phosphatidate cytidylyltransferase [Candidatus Brocadiae bacterium]|nr:phosphatidate cytidylyltransferase [Candidatus Brocadiia bacterium]